MASIVNGLFAGRSGIASHGQAIAVVGDNISNSSTVGFKTQRAEFEDLVSGGQARSRVVGSGSQLSSVSTIFTQGTLESTGRQLDLSIAGNGFFVVNDNGQRYYTRAGNFKIDSTGTIVNQNGLQVMGFPEGGSGALEALSVNAISQSNIGTSTVAVTGNLDAGNTAAAVTVTVSGIPGAGSAAAATATYAQVNSEAEFSTVVEVFDSLGDAHTLTFFFFKTASNTYEARGFVNDSEVTGGGATNNPRQITTAANGTGTAAMTLAFNSDGTIASQTPATFTALIPWANGASTSSVSVDFTGFTQYSTSSNVTSISQNGKGIGTVTSLSIEKDGSIFALLSNGQSASIGAIGLVNFSNPEGLSRSGNNLLQQSPDSGEPIVGRPDSGTLGSVESGRLELSTVDIADQFVKLITLQRGFQANSRIITTINQLLNDIIQLA